MNTLNGIGQSIDFGEVKTRVLERPNGTTGAKSAGEAKFTDELGKALERLEEIQLKGDSQAQAVANGGGNLHEAALALEKADVTMRLANKVRNKFVETYQEIMRMNV